MRYFLVLIAVNLMWAFQFSGVKFATERLGPLTVVLVTLVVSVVILAPLVRLDRSKRGELTPAWAGRFILLGCGAVVSQAGMTWGIEKSLASNAAVLNLTIPVVTAVFASIMLNEHMTPLRWLSFALALGGVLAVSDLDWRTVDLVHNRYAAGNLLIFAGCTGSAFYNTYSKKLLERFTPVEVLVYSFAAASAVLAPIALLVERPDPRVFAEIGRTGWTSILGIAIFSLSLSMVLFLWVIDRIDVTQASLSIYLLPVLGVVISSITLHEPVTWQLVAGAALVFASTFLVTIYEERKKSQAAPSEPAPETV